MLKTNNKLKKIKGDASFRYFYRKLSSNKKSIIVFASKEKEKNLLTYDAINTLLIKNKVLAPKLYNENYKKNYIEIEDFGDDSVFSLLKKNINQRQTLYKRSVDLLSVIQKIKQNQSKNFNGKTYKIPIYDNAKLFNEANLFNEWYAKKFVKKNKLTKFKIDIRKQIKFLLIHLQSKEKVFVHRDFHVSNLMKFKNKIGVIDSQDASIGNRAYDLASLIDDVRFKTDKIFKDKVYRYYLKLNKKRFDESTLLRDFEILSILRNMKIIGIFTRLAIRDKKKQYLKLIPYAWKLIELRISNNEKFAELKSLLDLNFSKKIRNQR
ncbi:phosphotransferase [Candidatus Pelagibacter sp.]|nr:phosphotransferase [Candidatus Pelagibacter sp.]